MNFPNELPENKGFIVETATRRNRTRICDRTKYPTLYEAFENKNLWFNSQNQSKHVVINIYIILPDNSEKLYLGEFYYDK